jgi:hypothetical protein
MRLPEQLHASKELVRSWTPSVPQFYGVKVNHALVDELLATEEALAEGRLDSLNPAHCRVLAAYHGPKGAKVPLSTATVSGCVRPAFVRKNPWMHPGSLACYDGGCYLYHARAVPAKKVHDDRVRVHTTPRDALLASARLAEHFGVAIRDNQTSDGSLSMALSNGNGNQLRANLEALSERYSDVNYLCFSSAYVAVADELLQAIGAFPNLVVHVTVSGWHSKEENLLRLAEFGRYKEHLPNVWLRLVNRQDWSAQAGQNDPSGANCEDWLVGQIERRGGSSRLIRTPFHSVHPFPGSATGNLGSRHMAGTDYSETLRRVLGKGARECCTTGKCKSCPVLCGCPDPSQRRQDPVVAARDFEAMWHFETARQQGEGESPLAVYTARMLARKASECYATGGADESRTRMRTIHAELEVAAKRLPLSSRERRLLANDSHALVVDGMDRHRLWQAALKCTAITTA